MKYYLRNFENNFQVVNSMGWALIILSFIFFVLKQNPGFLVIAVFGFGLIWLQSRGKRITADTGKMIIKSTGKSHQIMNPTQLFMNKVKLSQNINSRTQTTNVKTYFYKAYLQDGDNKILLSSNKKPTRDLEKLQAIARDLGVEFSKNY